MKWLFILGVNNSGTTLMHRTLAQHPEIDAVKGEGQRSHWILDPGKLGLGRVWTEQLWAVRTPPMIPFIGIPLLKRDWLNRRLTTTGTYTLEKSPPDTVRGPWLQRHFRPTSFIGMIRNGYAVAEGTRRRKRRPISIERSARHWSRANEIMLEDSEKFERFLLVKYEDFVANPQEVLAGITRFLGIEEYEFKGTNEFAQDHNKKSISRLSGEDRMIVKQEAAEMLEKFSYSHSFSFSKE